MLGQDPHEAVRRERNAAGEHVVHDAAHRVDVEAVIGGMPLGLLGRHVLGGPEDHPRLGQAGPVGVVGGDHLRDAEVEHLDEVGPPLALHEIDVLRLHVAVDDAVLVRGAQRLGDLHQDRARPRPGDDPLRLEGAPEILAVEVLHRDVDQPLRRLPEVGDVDHVLVADARGALRLLQEARDQIGPAGQILEQDLERDLLLDERVLREVDAAHPPLADLAQDPVTIRQHAPDERIVNRGARVSHRHCISNLTRCPSPTPSPARARRSRRISRNAPGPAPPGGRRWPKA